jgi:hypothetical protein
MVADHHTLTNPQLIKFHYHLHHPMHTLKPLHLPFHPTLLTGQVQAVLCLISPMKTRMIMPASFGHSQCLYVSTSCGFCPIHLLIFQICLFRTCLGQHLFSLPVASIVQCSHLQELCLVLDAFMPSCFCLPSDSFIHSLIHMTFLPFPPVAPIAPEKVSIETVAHGHRYLYMLVVYNMTLNHHQSPGCINSM